MGDSLGDALAGRAAKALETELIAMEAERRDALVSDDMARFGRLISDDIVHVHTTGVVQNKAELMHHAGAFLQFIDIQRGPLLVREIAPDAAIMTGEMTNVLRRRGHDERIETRAFVTQVWVRRDGQWQLASFQAVKLPDPAPGQKN